MGTHLIVSSKITKVKHGIQSKSELYPVRLHIFDIAMSAAKLPNKCERATVLSSDRAEIYINFRLEKLSESTRTSANACRVKL